MGKSKRNKNGHRADPMNSIKAVKPPTDPELLALREKSILPVIKDLRSADPKARSSAASAVANIAQTEKCRKLLLREQIVPIVLAETLTDASLDSRAAGWEILRVIVAEEESDFCVHLFRLDILTAMEHAVKNVAQSISDAAFTKTPKAQQEVTWSITTALLSLLTALATARDEIMNAIVSNEHILPFLCFLGTHTATPPEVFNEALNCLIALSEDNLNASQLILADQSGCFRTLTKYREAGDARAVYACACLHNIYAALEWHDGSPGQDGATDAELIPALARVLDKAKQDPKTYNLSGVEPQVVTLALEILASIATGLQTSMAKNSKTEEEWNGFGDESAAENGEDEDEDMNDDDDAMKDGEDGPAENGNDDDDDEDMEMSDSAILADLDLVTGADSDAEDETTPLHDTPTLHLFLQKALPQLIRLANYAPASDESIAIQSEALAALNNIAWTLSCFDFSTPDNAPILKAWAPVANKLWAKVVAPVLATDTADVGLAAGVTSLAWAVARTLQGATPLVGDEQRKFMSLYKAARGFEEEGNEDPFQALGVKCIGVLGQLAQDPAPVEINREVGVFLITTLDGLPDQTPPADAVEALNQIMDIYGDENAPCDKAVFWKDGFLKHLEDVLPKAKTMVKGIDKRGTTGELRERADEAVLNLGRFITYKKKHTPRP